MASDGGLTVALDLELDDELRREGVARELVRVVQDARKAAGLEVSDRIQLGVEAGRAAVADGDLARTATRSSGETLAVELTGRNSTARHGRRGRRRTGDVSVRKAASASPA